MSMQYTAIFFSCKKIKFHRSNFNIFNIFAQNIDYGYMLEPPLFLKNKKNRFTSVKVGCKGVFVAQTCFPDENLFLI